MKDTTHTIIYTSAGGMIVTYCSCDRWAGRPVWTQPEADAQVEAHLLSMRREAAA